MNKLGGDSGIKTDAPLSAYWLQLQDLRRRFISTLWFFLIITAPFLYFAPEWYHQWAQTIMQLPHAPVFVTTQVAAPFTAPLTLAFFTGVFLTLPFFLYQLWRFIAEGLYAHERKFFGPMLLLSLFLFYTGAMIAYFIVCPMTLYFFTQVAPVDVVVMLDLHNYLQFVTSMMIAFGASFQLPLALYICLHLRWITPETLHQSRRYVIVAIFILAMILTPPDVVSQILLAIPLCLLFEVSVWLGARAYHRRGETPPAAK